MNMHTHADELSKLPPNIQRLVTASDRLMKAIHEWRQCGIPDYRLILDTTEMLDAAVVAIAYDAHDEVLRKEKE
jgi:hypothetical protein